MRKMSLAAAVALLVPMVTLVAGPALAQSKPDTGGAFVMSAHAHSQFGSPGGADLMFDADALDFDFQEGEDFSYSSIGCDAPAPHNDRALRISPDYPGVDNPDSVRHDIDATVTEYDGRTGTIEGTITTVHCDSGDEIHFEFEADFVEAGDDVQIRGGTWEITAGTGTFSDLEGEGHLTGQLTCLPLVLERHEADSCEELGAYSDAVLRLQGRWSDSTV